MQINMHDSILVILENFFAQINMYALILVIPQKEVFV
jgi:hypothetical protein